MPEEKKVNLLDYVVILVKWKHILIPILLITMISTYLIIYFFIKEEFEAESLIVPTQQETTGGLASLLGGLQNLPLNIGESMPSTEFNIYKTIIYSRSFLEDIIKKFNLIDEYEISRSLVDYRELAIEKLTSNINLEINDNYAYAISVSAYTPEKAAEMTNYVVSSLNKRIIQLRIQKSSDNRKFLEDRLNDLKVSLAKSEDSLKLFQKETGMFDAEEQVKGILTVYSDLETKLITKQIEKDILSKINPNSPQLESLVIQVKEFENKLKEIKNKGVSKSPLVPYSKIPDDIIKYFRLYRNVEINNEILKFVLPLYEQAKFDEQKDVPILQIVDYAIPPAKKSYPPRTIFTLSFTFVVFLFCMVFIIVKENDNWNLNPKIKFIKSNFFRWKSKS